MILTPFISPSTSVMMSRFVKSMPEHAQTNQFCSALCFLPGLESFSIQIRQNIPSHSFRSKLNRGNPWNLVVTIEARLTFILSKSGFREFTRQLRYFRYYGEEGEMVYVLDISCSRHTNSLLHFLTRYARYTSLTFVATRAHTEAALLLRTNEGLSRSVYRWKTHIRRHHPRAGSPSLLSSFNRKDCFD
jgi:hypothetical protein